MPDVIRKSAEYPSENVAYSPNVKQYCAHCGEQCTVNSTIWQGKSFCCSGCKAVYELLAGMDLCEYYYQVGKNSSDDRSSARAGVSMQKFGVHTEFAVLDDPDVKRRLLIFSSPTLDRVAWTVPTLHCASCIWLLEQLDRFDNGVLSSTVDIMRKTVTVDYHPARTSLRQVAEQMARVGYPPLLRLEGETRRDHAATRGLYARLGLAGFAAGNTMLAYISRYLADNRSSDSAPGLDPAIWTTFTVISVVLSIPVLLYSASPWFTQARAALAKRTLTLDVPVALGIAVLFARSMFDLALGHGEGYLDSFNGLVFFLLIGRLFQQKAFDALSFDRTYRSFFPLSVRREKNGESDERSSLETIPIEQITVGDVLLVRNGEVIPCDSILKSEIGYIDYSFVTGESLPVECTDGKIVHAGGRVAGRAMRLIAIRTVSQSELAAMWERSTTRSQNPRRSEDERSSLEDERSSLEDERSSLEDERSSSLLTLSDSFGKWFTVGALGTAVIAAIAWLPNISASFNVFTAVLIVACPCALTLAAPITLGTAMGRLGEKGIYLKTIGVLLDLCRVDVIFFDKTGTLTSPEYSIAYHGRELCESEREALANIAASSAHPISRAIVYALKPAEKVGEIDDRSSMSNTLKLESVREELGEGLIGRSMGHEVTLGSRAFVASNARFSVADFAEEMPHGGAYLAIDGKYAGVFAVRQQLRAGIPEMIARLASRFSLRLISGDNARDQELFEPLFGHGNVTFEQTPRGKIASIEQAQSGDPRANHAVLMIGDGLNDAGAMNAADVAIAVTDDTATLVPACDAIVRAETLPLLPTLLRYARRMRGLIILSLGVSILYNLAGVTLAGLGHLTPMFAAILMPLSSITVIGISALGARMIAHAFFVRGGEW